MTVHLYCVLAPATASVPDGLTGLDDEPVRSLAGGELEAWVSTVQHQSKPSIADVQAHDRVIEGAFATGQTPVPVRFGQRFSDDAACLAHIAEKAGALSTLARRVHGMVEMAVIVARSSSGNAHRASAEPQDVDRAQPGAGHKYLELLRDRAAAERSVQQKLTAQLDLVSTAVRAVAAGEERHTAAHSTQAEATGTVSHLVPAATVEAYRIAVASVQLEPGWRLVLAGPRAPYSFCSIADDAVSSSGMILAD